jgi:hypothetical protein
VPTDGAPAGARPAARLTAVLAAVVLGAGGAAAAAGGVAAVATPGSGTLTKCRDWLVYESCNTYHHVALPKRVAVGDRIDLRFGSNPKQFTFQVVAIRLHRDSCTLLSNASAAGDKGDRIDVTPCRAAANPAAETR